MLGVRHEMKQQDSHYASHAQKYRKCCTWTMVSMSFLLTFDTLQEEKADSSFLHCFFIEILLECR